MMEVKCPPPLYDESYLPPQEPPKEAEKPIPEVPYTENVGEWGQRLNTQEGGLNELIRYSMLFSCHSRACNAVGSRSGGCLLLVVA